MGNKHKRRAERRYAAGELAKLIGVHANTVRAMGRRGEIRVADGGGYWVNDAELERLKSGKSGNNA